MRPGIGDGRIFSIRCRFITISIDRWLARG
jgi:hypothetical protein